MSPTDYSGYTWRELEEAKRRWDVSWRTGQVDEASKNAEFITIHTAERKLLEGREIPTDFDEISHIDLAELADQLRARKRFLLITQEQLDTYLAAIEESARKRPQQITGTMRG